MLNPEKVCDSKPLIVHEFDNDKLLCYCVLEKDHTGKHECEVKNVSTPFKVIW